MKFIISLVIFLGLSSALASEPDYIQLMPWPRLEIAFSGGVAQQTGYLTADRSVGTYILGVNMAAGAGMMTFEWNGFTASHDTGEFALANNKDVRVSTFSFIPQVKVFDKEAWNIFVGFGLAQVGLYQYDPDYYTVYGTFILSGTLRYRLSDHWTLHYKTQWYGVRQSVNDQETGFEVWNNLAGFGWNFL